MNWLKLNIVMCILMAICVVPLGSQTPVLDSVLTRYEYYQRHKIHTESYIYTSHTLQWFKIEYGFVSIYDSISRHNRGVRFRGVPISS